MADIGNTGLKKSTSPEIEKLLSDPKYKIELHKLVQKQTDDAYKAIEKLDVQVQDVLLEAQESIKSFELATAPLRTSMAYGCYFGTPNQSYLWESALSRLSSVPKVAGSVFLLKLQLYPALLVFYAGGLTALASKNEANLKILFNVESKDSAREPRELILDANCTMLENAGNQIFGTERLKTPLSDHLFDLFNGTPLKELAFGQDIEQLFDEWEILVGMAVADLLKDRPLGSWAPVGRFSWRGYHSETSALKVVKRELESKEKGWLPLKAGLFNGDVTRAKEALAVVENIAGRVGFF